MKSLVMFLKIDFKKKQSHTSEPTPPPDHHHSPHRQDPTPCPGESNPHYRQYQDMIQHLYHDCKKLKSGCSNAHVMHEMKRAKSVTFCRDSRVALEDESDEEVKCCNKSEMGINLAFIIRFRRNFTSF